ncbi:MAG: serpin family protein [Chthoniobacterales bacterium]
MWRPLILALLAADSTLAAEMPNPAATAINSLGIDLLHQDTSKGNFAFSPYSIQIAFAMTSAGTAGETLMQMRKVLWYPKTDMNAAFSTLSTQLAKIQPSQFGYLELNAANRLFAQRGFAFKKPFLDLVLADYKAPVALSDFKADPDAALKEINLWVESQTHNRIRHLLPPKSLDRLTRLVIVNALYFKASWLGCNFETDNTQPRPFHLTKDKVVSVPTMLSRGELGYSKAAGFTAVSIRYVQDELQFLILLPDAPDGLPVLEKNLTAQMLAGCARLPATSVEITLPKFKLEPPELDLQKVLIKLGMTHAFDIPSGSADFDGMVDSKGPDAVFISKAFHKTILFINETGTEAAASSAVVMAARSGGRIPEAKVAIDRPFLFAVQHVPSGACLFLGRVTDPR